MSLSSSADADMVRDMQRRVRRLMDTCHDRGEEDGGSVVAGETKSIK